jgi:hypothetical protein
MRKEHWALLIVLMLPFLLFGIAWVAPFIPNFISDILIFSMIFGGVPYLIVAIGFTLWGWNKSSQKILAAAWWIPVYFIVLLNCFVYLDAILKKSAGSIGDMIGGVFVLSLYGCILGYIYVLAGRFLYKFILSFLSSMTNHEVKHSRRCGKKRSF